MVQGAILSQEKPFNCKVVHCPGISDKRCKKRNTEGAGRFSNFATGDGERGSRYLVLRPFISYPENPKCNLPAVLHYLSQHL